MNANGCTDPSDFETFNLRLELILWEDNLFYSDLMIVVMIYRWFGSTQIYHSDKLEASDRLSKHDFLRVRNLLWLKLIIFPYLFPWGYVSLAD